MIVLAIDADGTIFENQYPEIGKAKPGAIRIINALHDAGFCIIINSCRTGKYEEDLREWLLINGVQYCKLNENCPVLIEKYGPDTRKISADRYIDIESDFLFSSLSDNYPIWPLIRKYILEKYEGVQTPGCKIKEVSE